MANRNAELGPYGLYDDAKVQEIGLKAALEGTLRHLETLITTLTGKKRDDAQMEAARLRSKIAQIPDLPLRAEAA